MAERYRERLPLIDGAVEAVERLAARWPLGVASSSNRELIDLVLELSGLERLFRATVSSEEVARGKPAPDVYLEACRRLDVDPARAAAMEDSHAGIGSAKAAGIRVIAIPNPLVPAGRRGARGRRHRAGLARRAHADRLWRGRSYRRGSDPSRQCDTQTRPKRTQPLWPPRPIAFESATSTCTFARLVRDVVEVALRVGRLVVDRRREDALVEREHAHHRLDRAGRPEAVAGHRLRRRDRELVRVVAEDLLDRPRLGERRRAASTSRAR